MTRQKDAKRIMKRKEKKENGVKFPRRNELGTKRTFSPSLGTKSKRKRGRAKNREETNEGNKVESAEWKKEERRKMSMERSEG